MSFPKTAKGSKTIIEVCCSAWIDLLGYGSMLREVGFDPTSEAARFAIERLDRFQAVIAAGASKLTTSLIVNDGAVIGRDLSPRSRSVTFDFLQRVHAIHQTINEEERVAGYPGARCVVAAGFRIRRHNRFKESLLNGYGRFLTSKVESGQTSIAEGINSAITVKPFVAAVPEFQANFAFTKAYLAETGGSSAGFSGAKLFVDMSLFSNHNAPWISLGPPIAWSTPGMEGMFCSIESIDANRAGKLEYSGLRDAHEVAEAIGGSPNILDQLRRLRIRGTPSEGRGLKTP
ncbi:hypothetical protein ACU8OT_29360 (plasmid) [Rhizobium leguminosarum]